MLLETFEMFIPKILFVCCLTQFLILTVFGQYRYDCDEHFCTKSVKCRETECGENFRLIKNATKCGCCHVCVEQLKEGDACKTQELSVLPRQECGRGLICNQTLAKCVPVETSCTKEKRRARAGDVIDCDEFGFYEPVVCKSGALCYCVNKNGKRIFGTDVASKKASMNCNCARDYDKFPRKVQDGNFLRCLPNGNYDPAQCSDESCYCMGDDFHTVGTVAKSIKELLCYDRRRHRDDDEMLRSKCWHEKNFLQQQIQNYTENGIRVIGAYLPKCDLDGSYAPVQCKNEDCYCVKKNGDLYDKKKYRGKRPDVKNMTCRCLRDKMLMEDYKEEEKVKAYLTKKRCDDKGEYENIGVIEITTTAIL